MFARTFIPGRLVGAALVLAVIACGGGDLTLPADGSSFRLKAVSGGGQQGTVGTELPEPLVVQVTDGAARPVPEASIRFQTEVPEAELERELVPTNDSGYAEVRVQLGTLEGTQTIEALLANEDGSELKTTFALTAVAEPPDDGDGGGDDKRGKGRGRGHDRGDDDDDD